MKKMEDWTTRSELVYLKGLADDLPAVKNCMTRRQKLQNYLDTMHIRTNWGSINRDTVAEYLSRELARPGKVR